jgi:hypothetical protein
MALPHTFSPGTPAKSGEVNDNFVYLMGSYSRGESIFVSKGSNLFIPVHVDGSFPPKVLLSIWGRLHDGSISVPPHRHKINFQGNGTVGTTYPEIADHEQISIQHRAHNGVNVVSTLGISGEGENISPETTTPGLLQLWVDDEQKTNNILSDVITEDGDAFFDVKEPIEITDTFSRTATTWINIADVENLDGKYPYIRYEQRFRNRVRIRFYYEDGTNVLVTGPEATTSGTFQEEVILNPQNKRVNWIRIESQRVGGTSTAQTRNIFATEDDQGFGLVDQNWTSGWIDMTSFIDWTEGWHDVEIRNPQSEGGLLLYQLNVNSGSNN